MYLQLHSSVEYPPCGIERQLHVTVVEPTVSLALIYVDETLARELLTARHTCNCEFARYTNKNSTNAGPKYSEQIDLGDRLQNN